MNARELLKEARAELAKAHDHLMELTAKLPMQYFGLVDGDIIQSEDCLVNKIDSYLAAPSESAMETAMRIGKECLQWREDPDSPSGPGVYFDAVKAAALIEGMRRRVPRAMLDDVAEVEAGLIQYYGEYTKLTDNSKNSIAAKYGVVIE